MAGRGSETVTQNEVPGRCQLAADSEGVGVGNEDRIARVCRTYVGRRHEDA